MSLASQWQHNKAASAPVFVAPLLRWRADERQELAKSARCASSSSPSPSVRQEWEVGTATRDAGALPQLNSYFFGQPGLRPRGRGTEGGKPHLLL
jgi:hypothetical protein